MRAPSELWTAAIAAAADRHTMGRLGIPSPILMERAALCVAHEVAALREGLPVVVLCGPGNNGGDGLAVARQLIGWEIPARAVLCTPTHNAALAEQLAMCRSFGVTAGPSWPEDGRPAVVVDALLGTGSHGAPRGAIADALARAEAMVGPRVAVDVPTGVDPDTGHVHPGALEADVTVSFVRSKPGLHVTPGRGHAGQVVVGDIGLCGEPARDRPFSLVDPGWVARVLSRLPEGVHKGQRGHLGIVGGSAGTTGAAVLAAAGSLRGGAGLATIATDDEAVAAQLLAHRPEVMVVGRVGLQPRDGTAAEVLPRAGALCVGPGLTDAEARAGLSRLWRQDTRPAIWDASALDEVPVAMPERPDGVARTPAADRVLTPHPGEAARMLARLQPEGGWTTARVQADRIAVARTLAAATAATVILKGEASLVATRGGEHVSIVVAGSSRLATAGSGDVLAGLCGALLARGLTGAVAATVAAYVHALTGEGVHPGAVAMDIADGIPAAVGRLGTVHGRAHPRWPRLRRG